MNTIKRIKAAFASLFGIGAIMDSILEFSDAQAIASAGARSTNIIDLGDTYFAGVGKGTPIYINVQTGSTAFTSGATLAVWLRTNTSTTNLRWASALMLASVLTANIATIGSTIARVALPAQDLARYISLQYDAEGSTGAVGSIDAWLSLEAPTQPGDVRTWGWTA